MHKTEKTSYLILLTFLLLGLAMTGFANATGASSSYYDGNGTEYDPYLINTTEDLYKLQDSILESASMMALISDDTFPYYKLTNDMIMTTDWKPDMNNFFGTFDGNNYTISNLNIIDGYYGASMFGNTQNAEIKNIVFENTTVVGKNAAIISLHTKNTYIHDIEFKNVSVKGVYKKNVINTNHIGGVSTQIDGTIIENITFNGNVTNTIENSGGSTGGIVATSTGLTESNINNISFTGKVYSPSSMNVGGIAGQNKHIISQCSFNGYIIGLTQIGGITGFNSGTIRDCYVIGDIVSTLEYSYVAGIVGYSNGGDIYNCYTTSRIYSNGIAAGITIGSGEVVNCLSLNEYITAKEAMRISQDEFQDSYSRDYITNNGTQIPFDSSEIPPESFWNSYGAEQGVVWSTFSNDIWMLNTDEEFLLPVFIDRPIDANAIFVFDTSSEPEVIYKTVYKDGGSGHPSNVTIINPVKEVNTGMAGIPEPEIIEVEKIVYKENYLWFIIACMLFFITIITYFYYNNKLKDVKQND